MQYPGPSLIVNEGDAVTVTLHNGLLVPASIVFPGQAGVSASGACGPPACSDLLTQEAAAAPALNGAGGTVTYSFTAATPGTYLYQSGSRPELSVEMGLVGALIVRPMGYVAGTHASHPDRTAYGTPAALRRPATSRLITTVSTCSC